MQMKPQLTRLCNTLALLLVLGEVAFIPAYAAQTTPSGPAYEAGHDLRRYREMGEVMDKMQGQMKQMAAQMQEPASTPAMQKQMALQIKQMSSAMRRMSGLLDKPSMKDEEFRKQMDAMRTEMDRMHKEHSPTPVK